MTLGDMLSERWTEHCLCGWRPGLNTVSLRDLRIVRVGWWPVVSWWTAQPNIVPIKPFLSVFPQLVPGLEASELVSDIVPLHTVAEVHAPLLIGALLAVPTCCWHFVSTVFVETRNRIPPDGFVSLDMVIVWVVTEPAKLGLAMELELDMSRGRTSANCPAVKAKSCSWRSRRNLAWLSASSPFDLQYSRWMMYEFTNPMSKRPKNSIL